jgi:hypothetical protein
MAMKYISDSLSPQEVQDLSDLIAHPGWRLLEIMVDREWGAQGFGEQIAKTVGAMTPESASIAVQHLQQATVTQREVQRIMRWPREQATEAKRRALGNVASMNRGGL